MGVKKRGDRLLCHCLTVTWQVVEDTIRENGCRNVRQVTDICRAGGGCKSCHFEIEQLIAEVRAEKRGGIRRLIGSLFSGRSS